MKMHISISSAKSSKSWPMDDLRRNLKNAKLGDTVSDSSGVTVIDSGYIYVSPNTVSITQIGLDGKINTVQLNGPIRNALLKAVK